MGTVEQKIINEYRSLHDVYVRLDTVVNDILEDSINRHNLFLLGVSHRVKSVESLDEKLGKKKGKYTDLSEITDLVGFRIVTFFIDTVDEIMSFLPEIFDIDEENSVDKRKNLLATEFGYVSVHFICYLKEETLKQYPELKGLRFEIQLRSALQHAWAEIEHDLGYKSEFGIPVPLRREFSRVAGLLEIADNQFIELREGIRKYAVDVKEKIRNDEAGEILIDRVSLREFVFHNKTFNAMLEEVRKGADVEIQIIDPMNYLERLSLLNIRTLGDLTVLIENNKSEAVEDCIGRLKDMELDITTSNIILRFLCKAELMRMRYPEKFVKDFIDKSVANPELAKKYFNQYMEAVSDGKIINEESGYE